MSSHLRTPLVLSPVLVPKPWGGQRLHALGRPVDATTSIGESWDVADLPGHATDVKDPVSRIVGGPYDGRSLGDLLGVDRRALLGTADVSGEGRFPLLVKVLDAAEDLSVQVHPPRSLDPARFKTESWVVLDADDGAELFLGVRDGVTLEDVRRVAGTAGLVDLIGRLPARAGDVVHIPAGTIHALGAGVLVAEVQTPSDVTHRLWDWPDERDGGRELHVEAGLDSIEAGWEHNTRVEQDCLVSRGDDGRLVTTDAYVLDRETVSPGEVVEACRDAGEARVVMVLQGEVGWDGGRRGRTESVLLPAACGTVLRAGRDGATVLVARPRGRVRRGG